MFRSLDGGAGIWAFLEVVGVSSVVGELEIESTGEDARPYQYFDITTRRTTGVVAMLQWISEAYYDDSLMSCCS